MQGNTQKRSRPESFFTGLFIEKSFLTFLPWFGLAITEEVAKKRGFLRGKTIDVQYTITRLDQSVMEQMTVAMDSVPQPIRLKVNAAK